MEAVCGVRLVDDAVKWLNTKVSESKDVVRQADAIAQRLQALEEIRPELAQAVDTAAQSHADAVAERDQAAVQVAESARSVQHLSDAVSEAAARAQARQTLYDLLSRLPDVPAPDPQALVSASARLDAMKAQAAVYRSAKTAHEQRSAEVRRAESAVEQARKQAPEQRADSQALSAALSSLAASIAEARATLKAAISERDSSACHACGRPFEDARDPAALEALVAASQHTLTVLLNQETALKQSVIDAQAADRAWDTYQAALQRLSESQARLAETPLPQETDEAALEVLSRQCEALRQQQRQYDERARVLEQWYALPEPGPDRLPELHSAQQQLEAARARQMTAENRALRSEYALKDAHAELARAEAEAKNLTEQAAVLAREKSQADLRKALSGVLVDHRESFMAGAWHRLLAVASDFASAATEGAVTTLQREDDAFFFYEVTDEAPDGERRPIELASGHQQAVLGVGIKLALTAAVGAAFDVVLLDEVSAGATDELSLMMTRALKGQTAQCLLISHRQADAALADHVIAL